MPGDPWRDTNRTLCCAQPASIWWLDPELFGNKRASAVEVVLRLLLKHLARSASQIRVNRSGRNQISSSTDFSVVLSMVRRCGDCDEAVEVAGLRSTKVAG